MNPVLSKIIVAIDGSKESMNAADYAISMSEIYSSELTALYVIPSERTIFGPYPQSGKIDVAYLFVYQ